MSEIEPAEVEVTDEVIEEAAPPAPITRDIQCVWHTRVIVPKSQTPTGTEYEFVPMQVQKGIAIEDADYLLSIKRETGRGCCGGSGPSTLDFFQEV